MTFQFFSLKEWYGLWAQPCDLLWLIGWSRSDGVSLDTRPQRSYLFPPTFNTPAFTVSITPWRAHKPQEKKGRLEHRCRSIELHQNQNHPSHWDQLTLQSTCDVSTSSAGILQLAYTWTAQMLTVVHCSYFVLDFLHSENWLLQIHKPMLQKKKLRISKTEWFTRLINIPG